MKKLHERRSSAGKTLNAVSVKIIQSDKWKGIGDTHESSFRHSGTPSNTPAHASCKLQKGKKTIKGIIEGWPKPSKFS